MDSCNITYVPSRRISHLKFQKLSGGNTPDPQGGKGRPPHAPTSSTACAAVLPGSGPTLPTAFPQIQNCHYTPATAIFKCLYRVHRRLLDEQAIRKVFNTDFQKQCGFAPLHVADYSKEYLISHGLIFSPSCQLPSAFCTPVGVGV